MTYMPPYHTVRPDVQSRPQRGTLGALVTLGQPTPAKKKTSAPGGSTLGALLRAGQPLPAHRSASQPRDLLGRFRGHEDEE